MREFGALRRRRRTLPAVCDSALARWEELRWRIEEALEDASPATRPRRRALRVPSDLRVPFSDGDRDAVGRVRTIAERGLFLSTERPQPVGTPLHLRLTDANGDAVDVEGSVVWVRRPGDPGGPPGMGVEFADLDDAQRDAVAYLVEEALGALRGQSSVMSVEPDGVVR